MNLIKLKNHLNNVKQANLFDLSRALKINPDVVKDMLQHWMRKGKICKVLRTDACGKTCSQCDPMFIEMYHWVS